MYARSIAELRSVLEFDQTEILQDMKRFFENEKVLNVSRCYICDLDKTHITELRPREKAGGLDGQPAVI